MKRILTKMKQKRDVVLVVFSVILLLLIAGCKDDGSIRGASTTPFLGGTQALDIGFLEAMPPDEVADSGTFPFQAMVSLKNSGEYDLKKENVKVDLIGFLPSDFDVSPSDLKNKNPEDDLTPRVKDSEGTIIEPVETYVIFPGDTGNFNFKDSLVGNTLFIFRADVCYKYQTKAVSEICVLENMVDVADDSICEPSESKKVFSSGSPIQVNAFRQNVVGKDKVQFSFDIAHSGAGDVFEPGTDVTNSAVYCPKSSSDRRIKEDKVEIKVDTGINKPLKCVGLPLPGNGVSSGMIKLVNGKRTVTCTQTLPLERTDYTKSVDITLDFNYLDSTDREILVKHVIS